MHAFQPYPMDFLEFNPFNKIGKEWALLTAGTKKTSNPMTIAWGGFGVLWGKNVLNIYVRDSRYTKEFLDQGEFFSVAFLSEEYRSALQFCGANSGRDTNKWEQAGLTPAVCHGIPYPDEANLVFLCRKMAAVKIQPEDFCDKMLIKKWYEDSDMHTMYVGEIFDTLAR